MICGNESVMKQRLASHYIVRHGLEGLHVMGAGMRRAGLSVVTHGDGVRRVIDMEGNSALHILDRKCFGLCFLAITFTYGISNTFFSKEKT